LEGGSDKFCVPAFQQATRHGSCCNADMPSDSGSAVPVPIFPQHAELLTPASIDWHGFQGIRGNVERRTDAT
jgi:hypothetical protein